MKQQVFDEFPAR